MAKGGGGSAKLVMVSGSLHGAGQTCGGIRKGHGVSLAQRNNGWSKKNGTADYFIKIE